MKYTTESALKEIKRRANLIRQKHERRITSILLNLFQYKDFLQQNKE
jgi:hypothetical protein